jgi:hypothetical protein
LGTGGLSAPQTMADYEKGKWTMRTLTQAKKKAVHRADKTAKTNKLRQSQYRTSTVRSRANLKLQLGEILLYLQTPLVQSERQICWQVFESLLRQYLDLELAR